MEGRHVGIIDSRELKTTKVERLIVHCTIKTPLKDGEVIYGIMSILASIKIRQLVKNVFGGTDTPTF